MKESRTDIFLKEVRENLTENILPYWLRLKDPRGGFYGEVSSTGEVLYDAPRGVILNARIIWSFAAAFQQFRKTEYLVAAVHARDYFLEHFCDHKYGGVYWSVTSAGERLDTKKQLYAQGFAIYGLAELYKVTGDDEVLKNAINLYKVVESKFADPENGGYIEALSRDFSPLEDMSLSAHDINADKTMNSHLHILEAYANLYQVWPDEGLREAVEKLLDIIGLKVMAPSGHLQLYFKRDWSVLPGGVSYGHDIETSWLALECAFALKDLDIVSRVRPWAFAMGVAGNEGLLADGSMRYEKLPDGSFDDSRQWWVQAETVVGNLWLWKYHGDTLGAKRAMDAWAYIRENLVDSEGGEWWWAVLPDGSLDRSNPKAGFWKCPYHNTRMCLQILKIFDI
ncbi:MAG: AGE family epimerase/isomerase [Bacteroidales bacterium]|nr:AGE family epimerase/isomerase [Bacteroidales bacterium]